MGQWALDTATAVGTDSGAFAESGNGDVATAIDTGSSHDLAQAGGILGLPVPLLGSNDIAFVLGTGSTALAGPDFTTDTVGSFDLGAVFGDGLSSTAATGGNFLVDILPSL
jgi:hypothetical protein